VQDSALGDTEAGGRLNIDCHELLAISKGLGMGNRGRSGLKRREAPCTGEALGWTLPLRVRKRGSVASRTETTSETDPIGGQQSLAQSSVTLASG
jgi:hypothetical protein